MASVASPAASQPTPAAAARLRQVAILIQSLPTTAAANLLGQLDEGTRIRVRQTIQTLDPIDPVERKRAIRTFQRSVQTHLDSNTASVAGADEFVASSSAGGRSRPEPSASPAPASPLSFLHDVDDASLQTLLDGEHPQVVALVLASVRPEKAARLLPRLPDSAREETIRRIGRLNEIPDDAATELAEQFRHRLESMGRSPSTELGKHRLSAIFSNMADDSEGSLPHREVPPPRRDVSAPHRFAAERKPTASSWPVEAVDDVVDQWQPEPVDASEPPGEVVGGRGQQNAADTARQNTPVILPISPSMDTSMDSTDSIHDYLVALDPLVLHETLGRVSTREAMLTLCGLPVETVDAVLGGLPRAEARGVRQQMHRLGAINLREIDRAKEAVAVRSRQPVAAAA